MKCNFFPSPYEQRREIKTNTHVCEEEKNGRSCVCVPCDNNYRLVAMLKPQRGRSSKPGALEKTRLIAFIVLKRQEQARSMTDRLRKLPQHKVDHQLKVCKVPPAIVLNSRDALVLFCRLRSRSIHKEGDWDVISGKTQRKIYFQESRTPHACHQSQNRYF